MQIPEIPTSWIVILLVIIFVFLQLKGVSSNTTEIMGVIVAYVTGQHFGILQNNKNN